jgi:Tol biopolymer transport system component
MALPPGARLGPYEILGPLGAGGMGEVYRARDTKLGREVALKLLPELFAADPDRLMRFEREARTLASLNHPHIAQIYGIEEFPSAIPGQVSRSARALVMELVHGEDLAAMVARGPLPLDEAIGIARQIADALEAAHDHGIIHRDLKPANVRVRTDGVVKVLDFGLAKEMAVTGTGATMTSPAVTQMGVILGTAAYMAPEQARGREVDKRADIWGFGCVLYEMLTGRRPFDGDNTTDVMAAIVTRDPDWTALPALAPGVVRQLLRRCLDRDPRTRLRDIGEARVLLDAPLGQAPSEAGMPARRDRTRLAAAVWGVAVAAAAVTGYLAGGGARGGEPILLQTMFRQLTEEPGLERQPAISPDGKTIVYVSEKRGNSDLYLLRVGGRNAVLLTGDSDLDDYAPAFSPDGGRIAFRSERDGGGIFVMEATGESVRRVTDFGFDPRWSPDGAELAVATERVFDPMSRAADSRIWSVRVSDGQRRQVADVDGVGPRWSPDGRRIVFWGVRRDRYSERDIFTVAADGSQATAPVALTDDAAVDWSPMWSADGSHIYFASSRGGTMNLWRVAIDASSGAPRAAPEPITTPTAWSGDFDIAADGATLVFSDVDERSAIFVADFDPAQGRVLGAPRQVHQGRAINSIDITRDGRTIVFSQRGQPWEALGTIRADGSAWSRITDDESYHRLPGWSPDGSRLLFYMNRGRGRLWTSRPDGSELAEVPVPDQLHTGVYPVWSPDGTRLVAAFTEGVAVVDLASSPARVLERFPPDMDLRPFSWSADGRWIAGSARFALRDQLVLLDLKTRTRRVVADDSASPAWLPDGRRVLFSALTHISLLDVQSGEVRPLLPLPRLHDLWGRTVTLSGDGRSLVYLHSQSEGDIWMMTISSPGGQ